MTFIYVIVYYVQVTVLRHSKDTSDVLWLIGQAVKTSPSHGENRGSIPLLAITVIYLLLTRSGRESTLCFIFAGADLKYSVIAEI